MPTLTLRERCEQRLAKIEKDKDDGVYAKHYVQDVTALLAEIDRQDEELKKLWIVVDPYLPPALRR